MMMSHRSIKPLILCLMLASLPIPFSFISEVKANPDITTISYDASNMLIQMTDLHDVFDIYIADKEGTVDLKTRNGITNIDSYPLGNDYDFMPSDYYVLGGDAQDLWLNISNWQDMTTATIRISGDNYYQSSQTEDVDLNGNGISYLSLQFHWISNTQVTAFNGTGSFDYKLVQGQWGVTWVKGLQDQPNSYLIQSLFLQSHVNIGVEEGNVYSELVINSKEIWFGGIVWVFGMGTLNAIRSNLVFEQALNIAVNGTATFGTIYDVEDKMTRDGSSLLFTQNGRISLYGGKLEMFSCNMGLIYSYSYSYTVIGMEIGYNSNFTAWNSVFVNVVFIFIEPNAQINLYNVYVSSLSDIGNQIAVSAEGIIMDKVTFDGGEYLLGFFNTGNVTIPNFTGRNALFYSLVLAYTTGDIWFINPEIDIWSFFYSESSYSVFHQYEFDLTTTANSTIEISYYGQGGGTIYNATDLDGIIPTETISKGFYNQTGGNTIYSYEPFHLKISKTGCQTYETNFTLTEKTSWEIYLQESTSSDGLNFSSGVVFIGVIAACGCVVALAAGLSLKKRK